MALSPGTRFGNYEVMELVGLGGMGEVYRGQDHRLERVVALKVLPESSRLDREALERFNREALLLASVNHPNIATLHGLETIGDSQVLVMEFVDGETLDQRITRAQGGRGLPLDDALDIAEQIAAALDDAHQRGIVHRDLKPQNIDPRKRRRDVGDIRLEIHELRARPETTPNTRKARVGVRPFRLAGAVLVGVAATAFAFYLSEEPPQTRYSQITTPPSRAPHHFAVSPGGRYIAYVATVPPHLPFSASADGVLAYRDTPEPQS